MIGASIVAAATRRPLKADGGFTLIELITVLIIVAIMMGIAAPTLSTMNVARSGMAGKQLLRDMTFARQRSVATGVVSWVVFDVGADTWSIMAEDPANPGRAGATIINDMATGLPYTVRLGFDEFAEIGITSCNFDGATEVGFNWLGAPLNSTGAPLTAQGVVVLSGGNQVSVRTITGHVVYLPP